MSKKLRKMLGDVNAPSVVKEIAEEVCLDYTDALRVIAVENEPNYAKL